MSAPFIAYKKETSPAAHIFKKHSGGMQICIPPEIKHESYDMSSLNIINLKNFRLDIIFISSLIILSLLSLLLITANQKDGAIAVVEINGTVVEEYPLDTDGVFSLNGGSNTLTIKGGVAYITASTCPTHSCERYKAKWIGQKIVCLPNDVTVSIEGESDDALDFIPGG